MYSSVYRGILETQSYNKFSELLYSEGDKNWASKVEIKLNQSNVVKSPTKEYTINRSGDLLTDILFEFQIKDCKEPIKDLAHNVIKSVSIVWDTGIHKFVLYHISSVALDFVTNFGDAINSYKDLINLNGENGVVYLPIKLGSEIPISALIFGTMSIVCEMNEEVTKLIGSYEVRCIATYKFVTKNNLIELTRTPHTFPLDQYTVITTPITRENFDIVIDKKIATKLWLFGVRDKRKYSTYLSNSIIYVSMIMQDILMWSGRGDQLVRLNPYLNNVCKGSEYIGYQSSSIPVNITYRECRLRVDVSKEFVNDNYEFVVVIVSQSVLKVSDNVCSLIENELGSCYT